MPRPIRASISTAALRRNLQGVRAATRRADGRTWTGVDPLPLPEWRLSPGLTPYPDALAAMEAHAASASG